MKAVLIFDIEGTTIDDVRLYAIPSIESVSGKEIKATSDLVLRPLPKRKNEYIDINAMGWNSCLDEIIGNNDDEV